MRQSPPQPYRICLLGASLDGGNMGVCALGASLIGLFLKARPGARIHLFYGERRGGLRRVPTAAGEATVRVLNYRLSPRARFGEHLAVLVLLALGCRLLPGLRPWLLRRNRRLRALAAADFIGSIHAGDSFSDIYGLRRFLIGILPDLIILLLGKPLVFLPQTYGPFDSRLARAAAGGLMRRCRSLYARDEHSLGVARALLGAAAGKADFCPDVAFTLEPVAGGAVAIRPPLPAGEPPLLVGLNVSGLLAMGGYTRANMFGLACDYNRLVDDLVENLLARTDAHLLIVPHVIDETGESDRTACERVWRAGLARHERRVHLLAGDFNQSQVKHAIGRCDFFIGSRMHACIAALSQGIPAIGIAYSGKFRGVFESAGAGELALDARRLSREEITARCLHALGERERLAGALAARAAALRERLEVCFFNELAPAGGMRKAEDGARGRKGAEGGIRMEDCGLSKS